MAEKSVKLDTLESGVSKIRNACREEKRVTRREKKFCILRHKRIHLSDVEEELKPVSVDKLKELIRELKKSGNINVLHEIQQALCFGEEYIAIFLRTEGALYKLIGMFTSNNSMKQLQAVDCITNLATGPHKLTYKVAKDAGAYLVLYMQSGSRFLQSQSAWAASNIVNDCERCFLLLKAQGLLPALESLLKSQFPEVVQSATCLLHACTKYEDTDVIEMFKGSLLEILLSLKQNDLPHEALVDAMFALSNTCSIIIKDKEESKQIEVINAILLLLEDASNENDVLVLTPLIRCLGNLSCGTDEINNVIVNYSNFNNCIKRVMTSQYHHIKKEFLWLLSNLIVSTTLCKDLMDINFILQNVKIFLNPLDSAVKQALYFLCVLISNSRDCCNLILECGLLIHIEQLLNCGKTDIEHAAKVFYELFTSAL